MTGFAKKFRVALAATTALFLGACNFISFSSQEKEPVWEAWRAGDFTAASSIAQQLLSDPKSNSEALKVLTLIAHITGDYAGAIKNYELIEPDERGDERVREAVFESLLHLGQADKAYALVKELVDANPEYLPYYYRAKQMVQYPLRVEIDEVFELPFVKSEITEFFPGVSVTINGMKTTARFDTGGAFIHMSPSQAIRFGVTTTNCFQSFASLKTSDVCLGIAKQLNIGGAKLYNVPVAVIQVLENSPLNEIDDSPILGTNILQQFLVSIDAPSQRIIMSARGDIKARDEHFSLLTGEATKVPFYMWGDHFMIARGAMINKEEVNFFVDSGLVVGTPKLGQAAILAPKSIGAKWEELGSSGMSRMSRVPGELSLGSLKQTNTMAYIVPNQTWREISEVMGGVRVDALLSYGFLKKYAWTIDFDQRIYVLTNMK